MTAIAQHMFASATGATRPSSDAFTLNLLEPFAKAIAAGAVALNKVLKQADATVDWQESYKAGPEIFTFDESVPSAALYPRWLRFTADPKKIELNEFEAPLVGTPFCAVTVHGTPKVAEMAFILAAKDNGHITATTRDVDMKLLPPRIFTRGHVARVSNVFGDWAKYNFGAAMVLQAQRQVSDAYETIGRSHLGIATGWDKIFAGRLTA